jgi:hypothetical protein
MYAIIYDLFPFFVAYKCIFFKLIYNVFKKLFSIIYNIKKTSIYIHYHFKINYIQGDSRVIMSLTKFVMQPTLHVPLLCGFKKYIF